MRNTYGDPNAMKRDLRHQRTRVTGALLVVIPAQLDPSASGHPSHGTQETLPIIARPATTRLFALRSRPRPAGSSTPGNKCRVGRKWVVRSRKPPSNAGCSARRAGAFLVAPSKTRRESGGPVEKETSKAALLVHV